MLFISFILYWFYKNKNIKHILFDSFLLLGFILMYWILIYGTLDGFLRYIWGMFHLAQDNSSAAAFYPYNNWLVLILFLIFLTTIFLYKKTRKSIFFGILISISFFAAWKHGMAREDVYHVNGFFTYILICLSIFILFNKKNIYENLLFSVITVFLLSINMRNSLNYYSSKYQLFRVNNFIEFVSDFAELKQKSIRKTEANISSKKLPQDVHDNISNSTVDIYPWDYSFIPINNLTWQPRVVIQSYASYTSYLDQKNAEHFKSNHSPDYLIWETDKVSTDCNGSDLNSVDNRYLLNDEPRTILQILSNYDNYYLDNKFQLYKKRNEPILTINKHINFINSSWGKWIDAPENGSNLLRAKLKFSKSFIQRLKSFFYKDEQFWIYLKLRNGSIHKYRIVPKNAADGLWINPYIYNFDKAYTIDKIMFKCSNQQILTNIITVEWEQTEFEENPMRIEEFFSIRKLNRDTTLINSINDYEHLFEKYWNDLTTDQLLEIPFEGQKSHLLKANSFSSSFSFNLDSIPFQDLKITANCWIKSPSYKLQNSISLILSVEDEEGSIIWNSIPIDGQLIDKKQWNNIFHFIDYKHNKASCTLKAYLWNTSNREAMIDNFRIEIIKLN